MILSVEKRRLNQHELGELLRNYMGREPHRPIVVDALRREGVERGLIPPDYDLVVGFDEETHLGRWHAHNAYLVLRPAIELLGDLA